MFNPFKKEKAGAPPRTAKQEREKTGSEREVTTAAPRIAPGKHVPGVLALPHVTEKTTASSAHGWYTFRITPDANKALVKRAVEGRYGVHVERVHLMERASKRVRLGRTTGRGPALRKAMVKLKSGESIEFA